MNDTTQTETRTPPPAQGGSPEDNGQRVDWLREELQREQAARITRAKVGIQQVLQEAGCTLAAFPRFVPAGDGRWGIEVDVEVVPKE